MPYPVGNVAFDQAVYVAASVRQFSLSSATTQALAIAADNTYHQAVIDAGTTNGVKTPSAIDALKSGGKR